MKKTAITNTTTKDPKRVAAGRKAAQTRKARIAARLKQDMIACAPNWGWRVSTDGKGKVRLTK